MNKANKINLTKLALTISIVLLIIWVILGATASLAWFSDETPATKNVFSIGELNLDVSYKNDVVTQYTKVESDTNVFGDKALYEPGYTQVVYLKVENKGNVDFNYKLSVDVADATVGKSVLGNDIYLPNYLKYGVLFGNDEATLTREAARVAATLEFPNEQGNYPLNTYAKVDDVTVEVGDTRYIALIVYMPEIVGNAANYREKQPSVDLGITVFAQQSGTEIE